MHEADPTILISRRYCSYTRRLMSHDSLSHARRSISLDLYREFRPSVSISSARWLYYTKVRKQEVMCVSARRCHCAIVVNKFIRVLTYYVRIELGIEGTGYMPTLITSMDLRRSAKCWLRCYEYAVWSEEMLVGETCFYIVTEHAFWTYGSLVCNVFAIGTTVTRLHILADLWTIVFRT